VLDLERAKSVTHVGNQGKALRANIAENRLARSSFFVM
jgi:hypothetical protein